MSNDFIGVDAAGIEEMVALLSKIPPEARAGAVEAASKYLLNVLKTNPPYAYVPFKKAYGKWFSEKQRKYVMARISEGSIKPGSSHRTQRLSKGWRAIGKGENTLLVNEVPYAKHVVGNESQARMPAKIGWKKTKDTVKSRMSEIIRKANAGVKNALHKLGL